MPKHADLPLVFAAALALTACALDDFDDSVTDTRVALGDKAVLMPEQEFASEVRTDCRLPGAALTRHDSGWRLTLPPATFAARSSKAVAARIACAEKWARQRGLTFAVAEGR